MSAKMRMLSSFSPSPSSIINPPNIKSKTSSNVLFARNIVIVIAVMFFLCGLLHLLVKYLIKKKRISSSSSRFQESGVIDDGGGDAYERQLQQLFNLHDAGLDQDFIDALPVFTYGELMGLKEPFDCAVCLCEFTQKDSLRLLPLCSHAFHMHCIDTWLLSNSTCPLCRGTLFTPGFYVENPVFEVNDSREEEEEDEDDSGQRHFGHFKQFEGSIGNEKRMYPVRLGKFRGINVGKREGKEVGETSNSNFNDGCDDGQGHFGHFNQFEGSIANEKRVYDQEHFSHFNQHECSVGNEKRVYPVKLGKFRTTNVGKREEREAGETSNSNLDARRCYSMGTYKYVVGNSELRVECVSGNSRRGSFSNKMDGSIDGSNNGKKISNRSKGESFSVSKIWLWSKKDHNHQKSQIFSGTHVVNSSVNVSLPLRNPNNSHS